MVRKFPGKVLTKFENLSTEEDMGKKFQTFGYTSQGCPLFRNFVPLAIIDSCWKFKPEVLMKWKAPEKIVTKAFIR